jgi:hypothetical protein
MAGVKTPWPAMGSSRERERRGREGQGGTCWPWRRKNWTHGGWGELH